GVFKTRGAFNRQLAARERGELDPSVGIVVASGGNAGLANAYAAGVLGVPATVFVPETAPEVKIKKIREYGADVRKVGAEYAEAYEAAIVHANARGALLCHAYDQPEVAAGAGTLAEEILEDEPAIDTIVVAVGGGGLFSRCRRGCLFAGCLFGGVAEGGRGTRPRRCGRTARDPDPVRRAARGSPGRRAVSGVAADSLGARRVGEIAFDIASRVRPTSVLVDEDAIVVARLRLWREYRIAAVGAAAAFAALTSGAYTPAPGERVAVVVCGANTDVRTLEPEA
ncbi:MAG TPA: pyridoxal-phosphate dependent enzyme, partial [Mycobacteriales bacterium]|nr:pyridoxal-phosphate dependent enzyme [Mycobacteriales bacterium]